MKCAISTCENQAVGNFPCCSPRCGKLFKVVRAICLGPDRLFDADFMNSSRGVDYILHEPWRKLVLIKDLIK